MSATDDKMHELVTSFVTSHKQVLAPASSADKDTITICLLTDAELEARTPRAIAFEKY